MSIETGQSIEQSGVLLEASAEDQELENRPEAKTLFEKLGQSPWLKRMALAATIFAESAAMSKDVSAEESAGQFSGQEKGTTVAPVVESKENEAREKEFTAVLDTLQVKWGQYYSPEQSNALKTQWCYIDSAGAPFRVNGELQRPFTPPEMSMAGVGMAKIVKPKDALRIMSVLMFGKPEMEDSVIVSLKKAIDDPDEAEKLGFVITSVLACSVDSVMLQEQATMMETIRKTNKNPLRLVREAELKAMQEGAQPPEIKK